MSLKNKIASVSILFVLYISSCANQSTPTGGPRDEDPPVLIISIPENKSLNFHGQTISVEFDEYIKLNNPKEEIIITPRILGEYEVSYKKNKAVLEFEDSLQTNTTYTVNFREGIQDLNESNSPENLQIAFSTGTYLDSLTLSGNVYHLLTGKSGDDISVSLYDATDTLDIFNSPPVYFTKSNMLGDFVFNNLKNGVYKIYALNDKNKNLKLESKSESYAYLDYSIELDSNITKIKLPLINLDITVLKMQSAKPRGHYYVLKYNKYLSSYSQLLIDSSRSLFPTSFSSDHLEVKYYNSDSIINTDSLGVIITAYDTINNSIIDTVYVKFEPSKRNKDDFNYTRSKVRLEKTNPSLNVELAFTKPIYHITFDSIHFQVDSTKQLSLDSADFTWNSNKTKLTINKSLDPKLFEIPEIKSTTKNTTTTIIPLNNKSDKTLTSGVKDKPHSTTVIIPKNNDTRLYIGTTTFLSVEQDTSLLATEKATFTNPTNTGIIIVNIETLHKSFYTQLLNSKGEIISENYSDKKISFENTPPDTYTIRVLIDQNENKVWNIGDITKNILPEPVIFYKSEEGNSEIILKANWDYKLDIIKF